MAFGLTILAVVWLTGWVMDAAPRRRLMAMAALWALILLATVALPFDHGLRQRLGGDARPWLILGGLAALVLAYRAGLQAIRARVRPVPVAAPKPGPARQAAYTADELTRYSRQILLREIGGPGQRKLKEAHVLVVGAGGLGAPALLYLAGAGVGRITVIDADTVDLSNLHRQIIHTTARIGQNKAQSAAEALRALNPSVTVTALAARLTPENAPSLVAAADLVLDGTDNFDTRYLVNAVCVAADKPLIAAALTQWEGQISLWHPAAGAPCYQCVFPTRPAPGMVAPCAEAGVAGPLPGIMGSLMAMEAVKHLTGAGETLSGRLMLFNALGAETRVIRVRPRADCPCCGGATLRSLTPGSAENPPA